MLYIVVSNTHEDAVLVEVLSMCQKAWLDTFAAIASVSMKVSLLGAKQCMTKKKGNSLLSIEIMIAN